MKEKHPIILQIHKAQTNNQYADEFIRQYSPFIKSETAKFIKHFSDDGQEELNIAMFAFYECILSYQSDKGSFLKLAETAIKNRLIDYYRKEQRHSGILSIDMPANDDASFSLKDTIAAPYDEMENLPKRIATQKEIQEFTEQLSTFGLILSDVADNCPKQDRTFSACMKALDYAKENADIFDELLKSKKLPIARLSDGAQVERKTLERHRKYVVAILLAYTNGFEIIRGHLNMMKRKEAFTQ